MAEQTFKRGDVVRIASNDRCLDCCGGKRGVIYGHAAWDTSLYILNTDHFCPVGRHPEELTLVPAEELAREYFDIEGEDVFDSYVEAVEAGDFTVRDIGGKARSRLYGRLLL